MKRLAAVLAVVGAFAGILWQGAGGGRPVSGSPRSPARRFDTNIDGTRTMAFKGAKYTVTCDGKTVLHGSTRLPART